MRALMLTPLLLLAACGSKEETITVKNGDGVETKITTEKDGGTTTLSSDKGNIVFKEGAEGASFPAYAPQYPGSEITSSANFTGTGSEGGSGSMVTQTTSDAPDKVMAFYKAKITEAGMKTNMETTTPEGAMMMVGDASGKSGMMITMSKGDDGKTTIAFMGGQDTK